MSRFINPFTDVGFKRIFGQEVSKPILIELLNIPKSFRKLLDFRYMKLNNAYLRGRGGHEYMTTY